MKCPCGAVRLWKQVKLAEQDHQKRDDRDFRASEQHGRREGRFNLARSGWLTVSVIAAAVILFAGLWRAHQKAQFHQLRTSDPVAQTPSAPTVGGAEALSITRLPLEHSGRPEFSSATLLPGLGMQVLQLTATSAGGEVYPLLAGPTVEQAAGMPATAVDAGPIHLMLAPAGQAKGTETDVIATNAATDVVNRTQADGGEANGTFAVLDGDGKRSGVEAKVDAVLNGRSFELSIRVRNNALSSREFSLNWSPHFAAPSGDLSNFRLSLPSSDLDAVGSVRHAKGGPEDFEVKDGASLPATDVDLTYVNLESQDIGDGPAIRLVNVRNGIVLRIQLLSPSIRSIRVRTDNVAKTLMLGLGTKNQTGGTLLQAGESAEWRVRIDVGSLNSERSGPLLPY